MAAFAVLKMSFSIIDQKMPEYQDYLEYDVTTCHEEDEKRYSNSAMLKKIQKDKKSGNYHSIYVSMYEKILKEIVKYDYRRAAPHTWVNNFVKSVLWEETNPGKKKASLIYENLIKKAEDGLAIKGINDPTDQEIAEFVENEMKRKQRISATTVKNTKKANPTITSIFVADEDGQQEIIEIPDYTNSPEQIVMQKFFYQKIGFVLDGLPYGYSILARIYLESFFESDKAITIKALRERYIQESNDVNVSKNAIETALKEIKFILKNSLKLNKQKSVPFVFEPMEFMPKKEEMDQDEEDAYEAFCEEQPDGSKIIKIKKKDKEEKEEKKKKKD